MTKIDLRQYLKITEEFGVLPNFFVSEPYLLLSGVRVLQKGGYIYLQDRHWCLFPPIPFGEVDLDHYPVKRIWSTYLQDEPFEIDRCDYSFLDYNYIFDPVQFTKMEGHKWETFRKNCRKWPRSHPEWKYTTDTPNAAQAGFLIAKWLEAKKHDVHDGELLARFAYFEESLPIYRKYLYRGKELVAINAWDENWKYINYRVCFVKQGEPFLDEFVRWLFYTDPEIIGMRKLVNDGGTLGNKGLEAFKDKMNPYEKHKIYSWIKKCL